MLGGKCWSCGAELANHDYGRESNCLSCNKPTRSCKNCRWYAPGRTNDCLEPVAEPVKEKERANYCEFFEPTEDVQDRAGNSVDDALKAAEALFKL
ncbi:MAG: hypothetical protein C0631_02115 [Sedimenticola sp.]|jgi:hypothetical protein|nr:MAG: hypothetical protein C0631_02115 [Sedimenticola sp.]